MLAPAYFLFFLHVRDLTDGADASGARVGALPSGCGCRRAVTPLRPPFLDTAVTRLFFLAASRAAVPPCRGAATLSKAPPLFHARPTGGGGGGSVTD